MKATRIKWDESMAARCLSKWADNFPEPVIPRKKVPDKAAESDCWFKMEIPSASPVTKAKDNKKGTKWDDFKMAVDKAI